MTILTNIICSGEKKQLGSGHIHRLVDRMILSTANCKHRIKCSLPHLLILSNANCKHRKGALYLTPPRDPSQPTYSTTVLHPSITDGVFFCRNLQQPTCSASSGCILISRLFNYCSRRQGKRVWVEMLSRFQVVQLQCGGVFIYRRKDI